MKTLRATGRVLALSLLVLASGSAFAQTVGTPPLAAVPGVGIGTSQPDPSAALDISSSGKGVLFPRVSLSGPADGLTVASPATGLVVFNTAATVGGGAQLVVNTGTATRPAWSPLGGASSTGAPGGNGGTGGNGAVTNGWALAGNSGTSGNFLGTIDNQPLVVRAGNSEVARFQPNGALWVGTEYSYTSGSFNLLLGYQAGAGAVSTPIAGHHNLLMGYQAGYSSTGNYNLFLGYRSGYSNTTADGNVFIGQLSGTNNTTGNSNLFIGSRTGYNNTTGAFNVFLGPYCGQANTTGNLNTFIGNLAGNNNTTGELNTFLGPRSGQSNTTGELNTFLGAASGMSNTTGFNNLFASPYSGRDNTTGENNVYLGNWSGGFGTTASYNVAIGPGSAVYNLTGSNLVAVGYRAGTLVRTGSNNTFLGYMADLASITQHSNATAIGYMAQVDADNALVLGGTGANAVNVGIGVTAPTEALQVAGNILASGTITQNSDRRLKANVRPLGESLGSVARLRAVRYVFLPEKGPTGEQIGLIAQELEQVYPELVRTDAVTGLKSVNYAQLTPVLLEAIQELQARLDYATSALAQGQENTQATLQALEARVKALEAAAPVR